MFTTLTSAQIISLLISYGYFIIFPIAVVEGPIVSIITGFLAVQGYFNIVLAYFIFIIADLVGDNFCYMLGYFGQRQALKKIQQRLGDTEEEIFKLKDRFVRNGAKILLTGKLTHFAGTAVLIASGAAHYNLWRFQFYNGLGSAIKVAIFLFIGLTAGEAYKQWETYLSYAGFISTAIVILMLALAFYQIRKIYARSDFLR